MLFGIDGVDLIIILVLAVVMFGPEKLLQYSRKVARLFVYFRDIANNAKTTLSTELGPEYADLELKDLNPKTFISKQLRDEVALLDEAKRELKETQDLLKQSSKDVEKAANLKDVGAGPSVSSAPALEAGPTKPVASPFDTEAT